MPTTSSGFDRVLKIGLALPGVQKGTCYGSPALKLHGHLLACIPVHRSAEPASLVVRVSSEERAELLAAEPDIYYLTDHYIEHDSVLVRLSRIDSHMLQGLLAMAHKYVAGKSRSRSPYEKRSKR